MCIRDRFRSYQRAQPLLNLAAFVPLPRWMPRLHRRKAKAAAADIRALITRLTDERAAAIRAGTAINEYWQAQVRYGLSVDNVSLDEGLFFTPDPVTGVPECDPEIAGRYLCEALGRNVTSSCLLYTSRCV